MAWPIHMYFDQGIAGRNRSQFVGYSGYLRYQPRPRHWKQDQLRCLIGVWLLCHSQSGNFSSIRGDIRVATQRPLIRMAISSSDLVGSSVALILLSISFFSFKRDFLVKGLGRLRRRLVDGCGEADGRGAFGKSFGQSAQKYPEALKNCYWAYLWKMEHVYPEETRWFGSIFFMYFAIVLCHLVTVVVVHVLEAGMDEAHLRTVLMIIHEICWMRTNLGSFAISLEGFVSRDRDGFITTYHERTL